MATQYIKYAKKCEKSFFFKIIRGAMAPFGQGVATPMINWVESICVASLKLKEVGQLFKIDVYLCFGRL